MKTLKRILFYIAVPVIYLAMLIHTAFQFHIRKKLTDEAVSAGKRDQKRDNGNTDGKQTDTEGI